MDPLLAEIPTGSYSLLLYHYPQGVKSASQYNVQVQLSGHTHGGQIRLPLVGPLTYPLFVREILTPYIMGRYQVGPTTLYVSRGEGMQGGIWPRIRFMCPPELVMLYLEK